MQTIEQQACKRCGKVYIYTPSVMCECEKIKSCSNCKHQIRGIGCFLDTMMDDCKSWEAKA